ncbi:MAG: hypothetical protein ABIW84_01170, partial [Ilumatobacteraceae bacterium]
SKAEGTAAVQVQRAANSPKTSQDVWMKCRMEYESGAFTSVKELSEKHGINYKTLFTRIDRDGWRKRREEILSKAQSKVEVKAVNQGLEYLQKTFLRSEKYEKILETSMEKLASKTEDGTPILDPDAIDSYTRSASRIHALALSALRIPAAVQVDVTSKGLSVGESIVTAIAKLRDSGTAIDITPEEVARVARLEVSDDGPQSF